jgi:flagellar assembly factor FliW
MVLQTTRFGEQEVAEEKIIAMSAGMVGFPAETRYVLLTPPKGGPFLWLQSVDNPALAFVVVDAKDHFPEYRFTLTEEEYRSLELSEGAEVISLLVVTMAPDPYQITVNLQGPVVLNADRMLAGQIVLDGTDYPTRFPFFQQCEKK